ncbi:ATP-binding protein [Streptomyces chryseus]|uniref:ATP-binding protein n=1 Tax=Streptomyces chryseus TaxID=68186 RepID=UPI00110FB39B|nr:ATP-binding protein [Streptomyces chryseus]GGX47053.1 hypothetical protein GCM10010353_71780 [Streptomyces chryseus]
MTNHTPLRRPSQLPPASKDHFLGLTGANAVGTKAVAETEDRIRKVIKYNAMACIHGNVGLGKTFAVHTVLRRYAPDTTLRLRFRQSPNISELRGALWRALDVAGEPPQSADLCGLHLKEALEQQPRRILLFDEAQWLGKTALEYIRDLWGDDAQRATTIFVGTGNIRQKILGCPALHSRIFEWYQFKSLTPGDVLAAIPAYHPIWTGTDPDLILYTDDYAGHGSFRERF